MKEGGMGETVNCESFLSSMRDISEDSNSCSWSMYRQSRTGHEKDVLKQTMLEHEAVFKNQVYELHRLYRTQKSLMYEVKGSPFIDHINCSSLVHMQDGVSSRDKVRPVKLRRKMIDLQLPADEYLDTDNENMSCTPYAQLKTVKEVEEKLFFGRGSVSCRNDSSGSSLLMNNQNGLTDLNKPVQCQESVPVSSRDLYSLYGRNVAHVQGQWYGNRTPSHSVHGLSNSELQPMGHSSSTNHRKLSGVRSSFEWEARQRNPEVSYDSYVESSVASNAPSLNHNSYLEPDRHWSHWSSSWENRSSSSVQKNLPLQMNPFLNFNTEARGDSSSALRSNTEARGDSSSALRSHDFKGIYQGFSSGSKEPAFQFPSGNFNHQSGPNGAVTNLSLSETLKHENIENLQGPKTEECSAGLPWIKPNRRLDLNASANQFLDGSDVGESSNNGYPRNGLRSVKCSNDSNSRHVEMAYSHSRKILGFPIPQKYSISEEHLSIVPSSMCITNQPKKVNTLVKRNLDINLPCETSVSEAVVMDKVEGKRAATYRQYIDLNLCASEEVSSLCSNSRVERKTTTLIDLEAPLTLESEEEEEKFPEKRDVETCGSEKSEAGNSVDDLIKAAAESIVTMSLSHHCRNTDEAASSSTNAVAKDPLSWFVNTIASCGKELEKKIDGCLEARDCEGYRENCSSGEFDYFEAMTLNLLETKEEDYMPKPLVPEYLELDGTGSIGISATRPRRGQARRGRPRRDFQRDILSGLASLSRLEVTEDLQMFGGLMKITGYNWNSGATRRSSNRGGCRGRKRLASNIDRTPVSQPMNNNNVQMVGLEDRSFTGWGNATRRARRQRCPAGTLPTVILT